MFVTNMSVPQNIDHLVTPSTRVLPCMSIIYIMAAITRVHNNYSPAIKVIICLATQKTKHVCQHCIKSDGTDGHCPYSLSFSFPVTHSTCRWCCICADNIPNEQNSIWKVR